MRKQLGIISFGIPIALLCWQHSPAQNLIKDSGFEDTVKCPYPFSVMTSLKYWFNPSSHSLASPDYYHRCAGTIPVHCASPRSSQEPRSGNAYIGIIAYDRYESREYIQTKFIQPMKAGYKYYISFYVSLGDSMIGSYAIDKMGAYISVDTVKSTTIVALPYIPQIGNPKGSFITDSAGWTLISGTYSANGGERFITIGNFYNDANTDTLRILSDKWGAAYTAYYLIEDVSVMEIPKNNIFLPNAFSPNGDDKNDLFKIQEQNIKDIRLLIFNRWGQKVFESLDQNLGWDGTFNNGACPTDVYFYYLTGTYTDGAPFEQKGNVTLMR